MNQAKDALASLIDTKRNTINRRGTGTGNTKVQHGNKQNKEFLMRKLHQKGSKFMKINLPTVSINMKFTNCH